MKTGSKKGAVAKNTSISVGARMLTSGAAALSAYIVAHVLGADGAGTFAQVRVLPTVIAALLGAGVTISTPYLVGAKKYPVQAITGTAMGLAVVVGAVGWGFWILLGSVLHAHVYTKLSPGAALAVGFCVPLECFVNNLSSVQQGLKQFKQANIVIVVEELVSLLIVIPLFFGFPGGINFIVVAAVGGTTASTLTSGYFLWRQGIRPWGGFSREVARDAIVLGLKGHVGRIANMLNWRLDLMLLSFFAPVAVVGNYAIASKVAELFRPISASLTFVLRPVIAGLSVEEARAKGVELYRRFFALNLGAILLMAIFGPMSIRYFFGPEFEPAVLAFQILLIGLAAHGADGVINGYNVGIGRPEFNSYTALVGLVVTIVGDFAFIPTYSLYGAAWVSSVAYTAKAVAMTVIFLSTSGVSWKQLAGFEEYSPDAA